MLSCMLHAVDLSLHDPFIRLRLLQDTIYTYLTQKGMRQLSPEDAQAMAESGQWVLLDVRFASKYENAHPEGAESAPLYQVRAFKHS